MYNIVHIYKHRNNGEYNHNSLLFLLKWPQVLGSTTLESCADMTSSTSISNLSLRNIAYYADLCNKYHKLSNSIVCRAYRSDICICNTCADTSTGIALCIA